MDALFLERRDLTAIAAIDDVDLRVAVHLAHEAHAPRAQNAALPVEHQRRPEVDVALRALAVEHAPRKLHAAVIGSEGVRKILQRTLAAFVAHRAVERMVDEEELEHPRARLDDVRGPRRYDHAVGAGRRARRLQLRHLLDLHDADAARSVDADAGVIAVIRDGDPALDRGLQNGLALLDGDLAAVYRQRDGIHSSTEYIRGSRF